MRTLLILIALTLTACTELPDSPFENDPPTPPVVTSVTPTPPREPTSPTGVEDAPATCGVTLDRLYGCKAACDRGQLCATGQGPACLTECVAGVAAGSWCPFPAAP